MVEVIFRQTSSEQPRLRHRPVEVHAMNEPTERVLADLFASADFLGTVTNPELAAKIVVERLADEGFWITRASF
jgi:hypothetical protein